MTQTATKPAEPETKPADSETDGLNSGESDQNAVGTRWENFQHAPQWHYQRRRAFYDATDPTQVYEVSKETFERFHWRTVIYARISDRNWDDKHPLKTHVSSACFLADQLATWIPPERKVRGWNQQAQGEVSEGKIRKWAFDRMLETGAVGIEALDIALYLHEWARQPLIGEQKQPEAMISPKTDDGTVSDIERLRLTLLAIYSHSASANDSLADISILQNYMDEVFQKLSARDNS